MKNKIIKVGNDKQNVNIFELQDQFLMDKFNENTDAFVDAINKLDEQDNEVSKTASEASASAKKAESAANLAKSATEKAQNEIAQYGKFRTISSSGVTAVNQTNVSIVTSRNKIPLFANSASGTGFRTDNGDIYSSVSGRAVLSGIVRVVGANYGDKIGVYVWINDVEMFYFYDIVPISSISASLDKDTKKVATALDKKVVTADKKKVLGEDTAVKKEDINLAKSIKLTVNAGELYLTIPQVVFGVNAGDRISLKVANFGGSRGRVEQGFTTFLTVTGLA